MKRLILVISLLFFAVNILFGLIITTYSFFNVCMNSIVIIITSTLIFISRSLKLKDTFRISLSAGFITCGIIQFILGLISPSSFMDNGYLITVIIFFVFEIILLTTSKFVSQTQNNKY